MAQSRLRAITPKHYVPKTSDGRADGPSPNLLLEAPLPSQVNQVYAGDITFIPTASGWLYLAVVIDLCTTFPQLNSKQISPKTSKQKRSRNRLHLNMPIREDKTFAFKLYDESTPGFSGSINPLRRKYKEWTVKHPARHLQATSLLPQKK